MTDSNTSLATEADPRLIVVAPTFYSSPKDMRYALALECCRKAAECGIQFVCVDASPSKVIRDGLEKAGCGFVKVFPQTWNGKKGAALREGIKIASELLRNDEGASDYSFGRAMIGFQEPEKFDMVRHWKSIARHMVRSHSDIVVTRRKDQIFRTTYPIEQYHSEKFANLFLDSLGSQIGLPSIDWTAGPVAVDSSMADVWLECEGEIWDAQLVPIIDCFLTRNATVTSYEVSYQHPESMKEQECGNPIFNEKRLYQLKFLSETVGQRMREAAIQLSK